jgi:hypothetical protein
VFFLFCFRFDRRETLSVLASWVGFRCPQRTKSYFHTSIPPPHPLFRNQSLVRLAGRETLHAGFHCIEQTVCLSLRRNVHHRAQSMLVAPEREKAALPCTMQWPLSRAHVACRNISESPQQVFRPPTLCLESHRLPITTSQSESPHRLNCSVCLDFLRSDRSRTQPFKNREWVLCRAAKRLAVGVHFVCEASPERTLNNKHSSLSNLNFALTLQRAERISVWCTDRHTANLAGTNSQPAEADRAPVS